MKYLLGRSAENLMAVIYAFSMAYDPQIIETLCRISWKVSPGHGNTSVRCKLASVLSNCVIVSASQLVILVGSRESDLESDAAGQGCTHDDAKYQRQQH